MEFVMLSTDQLERFIDSIAVVSPSSYSTWDVRGLRQQIQLTEGMLKQDMLDPLNITRGIKKNFCRKYYIGSE